MMTEKERQEAQEAEARRLKYQAEIDRWMEWQRAEEAYRRRLRRELDPFNWGHWK